MLSILIPTYNSISLPLVEALYQQAVLLDKEFEILLADDASKQEFREVNCRVNELDGCRYLQLEDNVGPACIRNYLAREARYPLLLFLDCDTMPISDYFLSSYLHFAQQADVVCGGFLYERKDVSCECMLRYRYGILVEEMLAEKRNEHPYQRFIGMNFMVNCRVFDKVGFDETMHFGYEDAYFGKMLEEAGINILHINNPVYHLNEDTSEQYLQKIKRSVYNLSLHAVKMKSHVRLLQWYYSLERFRMVGLVSFLFRLNEKMLVKNLTSCKPSLKFFAFYKLGYLCTIVSNKKS